MKASFFPSHRLVKAGCGLMLVSLCPGLAPAADQTPRDPQAGAAATHVLFMGADLAVDKDRVFHPVEEVTATSLVIKPGGQPVKLPLAQTANIRVTEALRLADTNVGLGDFKFERTYSAEADPTAQLARTAAMAAGDTAVVDLAVAAERNASMMMAGPSAAVAGAGNPEDAAMAGRSLAQARANQASAEMNLNRTLANSSSQVYDVGAQASKLLAAEPFDAIRVSFTVTAETALTQPYYGIIAQLRDPGSKPGQVRKWVYLKSFGPLAAGETQQVTVFQSGLPPGYLLEDCEVHVYDGRQELSTTLSRRRVALSDEEALTYRVIEYIGENKGRTLPAALTTKSLPPAVGAALSPAQRETTCYVRVTKDGQVTAAFGDADGKKPLQDATLAAAVATLQFNPALAAGKPVESIAPVKVGSLIAR